jgi:hypothetical protein
MKLVQIFSRNSSDLSIGRQEEIVRFYKMLIKMKRNRPNLNIDKIFRKLYPDLEIEKLKNI